jgi:mannosyl-3-phosphoglycerate phosphatase family protein
MQRTPNMLIFTDMDGSLLCHDSYSHEAAAPMLAQLKQLGIPVIPTTSKTKAELLHLRLSLGNTDPFIIENGAAVFIPVGYFAEQPVDTEIVGDFWVKKFVHNRYYWQSLITHIDKVDAGKFTTFSELTTRQIAELTGLDDKSSNRASRRLYGEPVVWKGSADEKKLFISELKGMGANVLQGGRFIHVSGECDKGQAMLWLVDVFKRNKPEVPVTSVAIGDSQNDVAMLEVADIALLIRSPAHPLPELERNNKIYISEYLGPEGWAQGVKDILNERMTTEQSL